MLSNHVIHFLSNSWSALLNGKGFDPAPFILLNPRLLRHRVLHGRPGDHRQKAQTRTDKANEEAAAKHREELAQFQADLLHKNTDLTAQIHTLAEQLHTLTEEVHMATSGAPDPDQAPIRLRAPTSSRTLVTCRPR